jgi:hypothetical protein
MPQQRDALTSKTSGFLADEECRFGRDEEEVTQNLADLTTKERIQVMVTHVKSPLRWDSVQAGDSVELRKDGSVAFSGVIDAQTADGEIVWVVESPGARRLFHVGDGYELRELAA